MSIKPSDQEQGLGQDSAAMKTAPNLQEIFARAQGVRLLALDVDGVLTDGALYFTDSGEEMKAFSTLDGQGIKLLQQNGVTVALISARNSQLVKRRAANLGINHVVQGSEHKLQALQELLQGLQLELSQVAYVGDDLPDLACIRRVGLGIAVANAHTALKSAAFCITTSGGGRGAVREVCDWIMQAQGSYEAAVARFY